MAKEIQVVNLAEAPRLDSSASTHHSAKDTELNSAQVVNRVRRKAKKRTKTLIPTDGIGRIRWCIWLYIILWLIEGGLRRWVFPGLEKPLLVVRDPVVLGTYFLAIQYRLWPKNAFMTAMFVLAPLSWAFAVAAGHGNVIVATYGIRCDFLHVPMIFIMGKVLTHRDLSKLCRIALWICIPYTLLMIQQFYSPQNAWVNRGVGGDIAGAGFDGALDKFRPPGTFSFITGPGMLYPMFLGGWFYLLLRRKISTVLMALSGIAIVIAIPVSISRTLFIGELVVAVTGVIAGVVGGALKPRVAVQLALAVAVVTVTLFFARGNTDVFDAFAARWERSTTNQGGVEVAIIDRITSDTAGSFGVIPAIGFGTGISTQVGQQIAKGTRGFGYSEGEWGRILIEGGILLGPLLLAFRLGLFAYLMSQTIRGVSKRRIWTIPMFAAAAPMLFMGQWGQATALGASVIAAGVCCAAVKPDRKRSRKKVVSGSGELVASVESVE